MILLIILLASGMAVGDDLSNFSPSTPFLSSYPSCFAEDTTWATEESSGIIPGIESLYSCQELCLQSSSCRQFTWYDEMANALKFTCFLYEHPTTEYPCYNCVSGPKSCTCSGYFSCQITDNNFVGEVPHMETELLCQDQCLKTDNCLFYTWLDEELFPDLCLMLSSCDEKEFNCETCHSGPADCDNISVMTSTTTTSTSSPFLSCFDEDTTWSSNDISSIFPNVDTATACQELCQNNTQICSHFTYYTNDAELMNMCVLFLNPSTPNFCTHCISGPSSCVCGDDFACQVEQNNLLDVVTFIPNEILCQEECFQSFLCNFYTYFNIFAHPLTQTCLLFSSCDVADFSCEGCSSGPDDCRNISHISTLSPTIPPTTTTLAPTTTTLAPTTTTLCPHSPEPQKHGEWFCPASSNDPPTCHLECHPGYVSNNGTIIICENGEWSSSPSCVTAVAIITGRSSPSPYNTVEIYGDGLHKKLPNLPDNRYSPTLDLVDSAVLLCGGYWTRTSCLTLTSTQQWISHSTTTSSRYHHSSASMLGQLYLLGGSPSSSTTEHLTPPSTQWVSGWNLIESIRYACAAKINPEVFVVTGGRSPSSVVSYNVTNGASTRLQNLITSRSSHGCVYLLDVETSFKGILVAGGSGGGSGSSSELYDMESGEWSSTGQLTSKRENGVRMIVLGKNILAMGGEDGSVLSTVDRFNLTSLEWKPTEEMLEPRRKFAVTGVPPNAVGLGQN